MNFAALRLFSKEVLEIENPMMETLDTQSMFPIDSVSVLELLLRIEKEFDIVVEDEDLTPALHQSLQTLINYIQRKKRSGR